MEPQILILGLLFLGAHEVSSSTDQKSSLTFVVDDTGSMQVDVHELNKTAKSIFDKVNSDASQIDDFIVVTFNDPEVKLRNNEHNKSDFDSALGAIEPRGGGNCAEMSMSGIQLALEQSRAGSLLWVFTDASAADMEKYYKVEEQSQKMGSQIYFAVTGLCDNRTDPDFLVYRDLAIASNGQVFHLRKNEVGQLFKYVELLIDERKDIVMSKTFPAGQHIIDVNLDSDMEELTIAVSGENPVVTVTDPSGSAVTTTKVIGLSEIAVVTVDVEAGVYKLEVASKSDAHLVVSSFTSVHFQHGFSIFTPSNINGTTRKPVPGKQSHLSIKLAAEDAEGLEVRSVQLLDMDDKVVQEQPLNLVNKAVQFYTTDKITPPDQMFKVAIKLYDSLSKTYLTRHGLTPIKPQNETAGDHTPKAPEVTIIGGPNINAAYYHPLQLRCRIKAFPTPSVIWTSSDKSANLTYDREVSIFELPDGYISVLDIAEVKYNATYTCQATNSEGVKEDIVSVQTRIIKVFNILELPENLTIEYQKAGRVACKAEAFPVAKVSWYKNGEPLKPDGNLEVSKDSSVLTIRSMEPYIAVDYKCSVENALDKKEYPFKLSIGGLEKPTIKKLNPNITVIKNSDKDIICQVTAGIPTPTISWFYKDDAASEFTSLNTTADTVHLKTVNESHAGTYFCLAENIAGSDAQEILLNIKDKCQMPKDAGPCRSALTRWFYNSDLKKCRAFAYGGCLGNENNFPSEAACYSECSVPPEVYTTKQPTTHAPVTTTTKIRKCQQALKVGPCKSALPKWYYDGNLKECRKFSYGGCLGNENNFNSEEACYSECGVPTEVFTTPQPTTSAPVTTTTELRKCQQAMKVGPCRGAIPRWYYDGNLEECRKFTYGGCLGNENNFPSEAACRDECRESVSIESSTTPEPLGKCQQAMKVGPCRGAIPRWYYDGNLEECRKFTYGGCLGNENNFPSEAACRDECKESVSIESSTTPEPLGKCQQAMKVGPCRGAIPRWYYDGNLKECRKFTYGGCLGNENNFPSEAACRDECRESVSIESSTTPEPLDKCQQPMESGTCRDWFQKWYYDSGLKKCRKFIFSGCNGNENQFDSEEACRAECAPFPTVTVATPASVDEFDIIQRTDTEAPPTSIGCFLDVIKDFNGNDPLFLTQNDDFTNFETNEGHLLIPTNETIKLVCPVKFKNLLLKEIIVTCESEKQFIIQHSGRTYNYSDLKCTGQWQHKTIKIGRQCSNVDSELLNIGFEIRGRIQEVYKVCLNRVTNNPIYTKLKLQQSLPNAVANKESPWFDKDDSEHLDDVYDCANQNKEISRILNKDFHNDGCCFAKRMLVNSLDVAPGLPQAATYSYLNVAPHWSNCNSQNWEEIEQRIRYLRRKSGRPLEVWTGVSQNLKLPDARSELKNLTLSQSGKEFQVPMYFWKVVHDPSSMASLAIIQVNVPDLKINVARKYLKCSDVCKKTKWMNSGQWRDPSRGVTYCCSLKEFKSAFHLAYYGVFPTSNELLLDVTSVPNKVV